MTANRFYRRAPVTVRVRPPTTEMEIDAVELGRAVYNVAAQMMGCPDDGGAVDLRTDGKGNTYLWLCEPPVSTDPRIAALVDASWILRGDGNPYHVTEAELAEARAELGNQGIIATAGAIPSGS